MRDCGGAPRAITHSTHGSFSLLRTTNDVFIGDASDQEFLARSLRGADAVVNCAINMKGTRKFAIAATRDIARAGARRRAPAPPRDAARAGARAGGELGINPRVPTTTLPVRGFYLGREGEP